MELNKIYIGDTLKTLKTFPDNSVDVIVTSPPFNKSGATGGLVKEVKYSNSSDSYPEYQYQEEQIDVLNELYRITKPYGYIFYDHKLRWMDGIMLHPMTWVAKTKWDIRQEIIWDRGIASNIQSWRFWQMEHRVYWMQKGITKGSKIESRHAKMTSIWRIRPENKIKEHPAPFPIELPTRCIYSITDGKFNSTILDPYAGSGSTLVAAKLLGCNYVGIDCSEEYVKVANERLTNITDDDKNTFLEEIGLHVVEKTYKERKDDKLKRRRVEPSI